MYTLEDFGATRYESKLNNGLRVVLFYRPKAPIYTRAFLRSGSSWDPVGKEGMSHLLEHMMLCGSKKFSTKSDLCEYIESVGGMVGAATNPEYLIVNTEVSEKEDFSRVVDIFEAALCEPLMNKEVFEKEKDVVEKEIVKGQSVPKVYDSMIKFMFKNTRYEYRPFGNVSSVKSITYDEMLQVYEKLLDVSRITFVASGDISIEELVKQLNILTFFSKNPFVPKNEFIKEKPTNKVEATFFDSKQTSIFIGFYTMPLFSRQELCMEIVGKILTTGRTGRLVNKLRYEKGLVYNVNFLNYKYLFGFVHGISTSTTENNVQAVVEESLKEIDLLHKDGITQKELDFAKNQLVKSKKRTMQTSLDWINFHAFDEVFGSEKYFPIHEYANMIYSVTLEEANETIKEYLSSDKAYITMVGRTKAEDIKI
jgi:predicted Zn-dependent peptidase